MRDVCKGKEHMKTFCQCSREQAMEIINFKNKTNKVINKWKAGII